MATIGDGNGISDNARVFSHHQLAIQLIDELLAASSHDLLSLLDVACGRGQMVRSMQQAMSELARRRIRYVGYDAEQAYVKQTKDLGVEAGLLAVDTRIGEIVNLPKLFPADDKFDLIVFTNTLHEIASTSLPALLLDLIIRLKDQGRLFIYDVEAEHPPELGAVAWTRLEIEQLVRHLLRELDAEYEPSALQWPLKTSLAWSLTLDRAYITISEQKLLECYQAALRSSGELVQKILIAKHKRCIDALESLTLHGTETGEEEVFRTRQLFDYWALTRALGEHE